MLFTKRALGKINKFNRQNNLKIMSYAGRVEENYIYSPCTYRPIVHRLLKIVWKAECSLRKELR